MQIYNQVKLFWLEHKNKIIIIFSLIILSLTVTFILVRRHNYQKDVITYENIPDLEINNKDVVEEEPKEYYFVDIKGYVNNPGVYSLEKGKRVVDAINIAGGLKNEANTSLLNLSRELTDQMVIIVYSNSQISDFVNYQNKQQQEAKICNQDIINDACITNTTNEEEKVPLDNNNNNNQEEAKELKVNINTATKDELMNLPNIGESKALAIIEYREKNGLFTSIDDIKNVSGIGDKLFEAIKENISI